MRKLCGLLLGLCLATAAGAQDNWVQVAGNDNHDYFVLKSSLEVRLNKAKEEIVVVTGKDNDKRNSRIDLEKWYVRTKDCLRQQGKVVALNMDGEFLYDYDFVFGAGSVGSTKAQAICTAYAYKLKESIDKGL
jgi:hypothetical protein